MAPSEFRFVDYDVVSVADVPPWKAVRDPAPNRTGGGPASVWPFRDRQHLRHDLNISRQGCGIISAR